MKASIVDLRYKTAEILKALDNQEIIAVGYKVNSERSVQPEFAQYRLVRKLVKNIFPTTYRTAP